VSVGSFSGLNDDAGSLQADDGVDRVSMREAWLQTFLLQERLRLVSGKIDLTNYFDSNTVANDETTQFITSAFVNNPTMEQPDNGPGFVAFFDTRRAFTFGFGLQSIDNSGTNITDDIYAIAEIGYRSHFFFNQEGNYRLWGKTKGGMEDNNGFGVSIDQNLSTRLTAFGRYGANESDGASVESAWSAGLRLRSPFFTRVNDEVAFAFGMLDLVGGNNKESALEVYYKFQVNDRFAVTPNFQAIFDPGGMGSNDTAGVIGIRTQVEF
jgi:carbohydrate-selective porin OprB